MGKKVWLDPGHGGSDSGAVAYGLIEKNMALITALSCRDVLQQHGVTVGMSRTSDCYVGLSERATLANNWGADYFVSIHYNAGGGDGVESICSIYRGKGEQLSNNVVNRINTVTGQNKRPTPVYVKPGDNGKDYFCVIRESAMDAIICECAFIDSDDRFIVDTVEEQKAMGVAIAYGILDQLGISIKSEVTPPKPISSHRNVVVYKGEVDKCIASIMSWKLDDCIIRDLSEYKSGMGRSVYVVGAACNSNIAAHVRLQGQSRFETLELAEKRVGLR